MKSNEYYYVFLFFEIIKEFFIDGNKMNFRNFFYSKYCLWRYFKIDIRIFINFKNYKYIMFFGMCFLRKFENILFVFIRL